MEEQVKYFTPSIEDIRVGYECEIHSGLLPGLSEGWHKFMISSYTDIENRDKYGKNIYRTPYLTKEQIEAEGWLGFGEAKVEGDRIGFEKGNHFLVFDILSLVPRIEIIIKDPSKSNITKDNWGIERNPELFRFQCECKDINTFRYICKLLGI